MPDHADLPPAAPSDHDPSAPPYAGLTPECVMDALDSIGLYADGRLLALNSYENRVYQVGVEEAPDGGDHGYSPGGPLVVAKFYRPQRWSDAAILEEHAFVADLARQEIPAVPALEIGGQTLHHHAGFRFSVFARHGGRAPELDDSDTLERIGRFIGRIHAVGAAHPFAARPALDIETFGVEPRGFLLEHDFIPPELLESYRSVSAQALDAVRDAYARAGEPQILRLHGDCHPGNVLWTDAGPHFVDFDDSRNGPAIQDLWMLLGNERADQQRALADLLAGYEDFREFDPRELHLIEALRTLRLIHYAAWLARRWHDPAFPAAFPWFGTARYWEDRIRELRGQIAAMDEPTLWPA
jgi:Ser/Thr protein kinase RdoA (MazF antagonist)